ncbi:response regulator [Nonomuraea angiospora]
MTEQPAAKVLVVDDEPNIRELLSEALELNGFTVRTASDGRRALAEVARERPDIIVLDVMMTGVDGFAVARKLREAGDSPMMLFLTARDTVSDRIAGLTAGGDDYVTKPFSLEEVVLRLRAIACLRVRAYSIA